MSELIQQGGPTMLWILALAGPALILAALHVARGRRWLASTTAAMLVAIVGIGAFGTLHGRSRADAAAREHPEYADELRDAGYAEAMRPIQSAAVVGGLVALGLVAGVLRRRPTRV